MTETRLTWKEFAGYGMGDFASHISWDMIGGFLLFFYTDVAGIAIAATGTLMLVTRVLDALIDPAIGAVVDRTVSRHGKARPYLLYGAVPFGLLFVALFLVPFHTEPARLIYAYITLNLIGIVYSFLNIPYSALLALMTRDTNEKMKLSSMRTLGSAAGTFLVTSAAIPLVTFFGPDKRRGFAITACLFAAVAVSFFYVVFATCRERYQENVPRGSHTLRRSLGSLVHNLPWAVTLLSGTLILVRLGAQIAITIYFAVHVLHNPWMISLLLPLISVCYAAAAAAAPVYFKWLGIRTGSVLGLCVGSGLFCLLPLLEGHIWAFAAVYSASSFVVGFCPTAAFAMAANAVDYQQWRFGTRDDGLIFSSLSLTTKVGMAAGGALIAFALARVHFNPQAITPAVQTAIRSLYYWVPPALMLLQIVPTLFYTLDKLHPEIVRDLASRSSAGIDPVALASAAEAQ